MSGLEEMEETTIRPARDADLAGVLELYRHLNPGDSRPDPARVGAAWSTLLESSMTTVFVADAGDTLAATCMLAIIPNLTRGAKSFGVIENVVTHPDQRRTGVGRAILQTALAAAWHAGCYKVMLASGRDEGTLRFYESCGFKRGGKTFFEVRHQ
jgi:GNAT superfamily N-acetyltransferase